MTGQRVVHYYRRAFDKPSGVTTALEWWAALARKAGLETLIVGESTESGRSRDIGEMRTLRHIPTGSRQLSVPRGLHGILRQDDLLYVHEGWVLSNLVAAEVARRRGTRVISMPHGVYEPLLVERMRLSGARTHLERAGLRHVDTFHIFYNTERETLGPLRAADRALVLPTGFDGPAVDWLGDGGYVGWFGRYDIEHKGLDRLLHAVHAIPPHSRPSVRLRGTDYAGGVSLLRRLIADLELAPWVDLGGPVYGDDKWEFLASARAYVHPSRWDSQGIALVEALSVGVPCLVSAGTRMATELSRRLAAAVFRDQAGLTAMLLDLPGDEVGRRAARYVANELSSDALAPLYADALARS